MKKLDRWEIENAVKTGANLVGVSFDGANLVGVSFVGASLVGASLVGASFDGANLDGANLDGASLNRASLVEIIVSWSSHSLIAEILWRVADTERRHMVAAFIGRKTDWCWKEWVTWTHPEKKWAVAELKKWVKDGDSAPELLR